MSCKRSVWFLLTKQLKRDNVVRGEATINNAAIVVASKWVSHYCNRKCELFILWVWAKTIGDFFWEHTILTVLEIIWTESSYYKS